MSSEANEAFAKRLLASVPELIPVYKEHLRDNGELLGHLLMADVARFVVSKQLALKVLLDFLESELASGDDYVNEVIALSFCENIMGENQTLQALRPMLGPHLSATLKQVSGE